MPEVPIPFMYRLFGAFFSEATRPYFQIVVQHTSTAIKGLLHLMLRGLRRAVWLLHRARRGAGA